MKNNFNHDRHRNDQSQAGEKPELHYRALALRVNADGTPSTLDKANRSVEVIGASEKPVTEFDYDRYEYVPTVLLMSGCQIPSSGQMPLLDTHSRYSTASVIGSYRNMKIEGDLLVGRAVYSSVPEAEGPWIKTEEGHLTDYSVGRRDLASTYIPDGQTQTIGGKSFTGPVRVVTSWIPKEMSVCPIGADDTAKARAAAPPQTTPEKEKKMDEKLRKYLERRGLPVTATEEEANRFFDALDTRSETPPAVVAPAQPSADETRAAAEKDVAARMTEIVALCDRHDIPAEKRNEYLKPGVSVETVRKEILDGMVERAAKVNPGFKAVTVGADERDKFRAAAEHSVLIRADRAVDNPASGATDLVGFSLRELARESLRVAGQSITGNPMDMIGRALTTSDLPAILANVANRSLFEGYAAADETWQTWCGIGSASDFKTNTIARVGEMDDLDEIGEEDEYKYGKRSDGKEEYKIATFGKLFSISRQTIINDDLGALTDIPAAFGEAWSRKVGDIAYAVLIANSAMGDGVALFHADHSNLGTAGVVSETTIAEGIKLMKLQKDISGKRRLNIRPQFFIAPVALEGSAEIFFTSNQFAGADAAATRTNPYAGTRFTRVFESRLDDASSKNWYLAGPKGKTVKVFFLNGQQGPYLETKQGWSTDGVEFKVRGDAAAKAVDWKAMIKNAGA
ncbi:prohead protease/major capsid protein fusion protein [Trichlorobacter lovleyi]|uniref:prohead protease/major capsid protein fusion protein n=1 Tax=Trichlorobacter lovleyi TaxID=313985 RepID=UPI003D141C1F